MDEVWTLQRSTTDGKLAGVCAALATRYAIDPLLVRIVCVLLALSAGIGLALYAAAWLVLPTDRDPVPALHRAFPGAVRLDRSTLTALVGVWTVLVAVIAGQVLTIGLGPVLVVAALWWFGVIKPRNAALPPQRRAALPPVPPSERDFVAEALAWRARVDAQVPGVDWREAPATTRLVRPTSAAPRPTPAYEWQPAPWSTPYEHESPVWAPPRPEPAMAVRSPLTVLEAKRRRSRTVLALATTASVVGAWVLLAGLGVTAFLPYGATALLLVGLGLVVATWVGRPKGLLPGAVVLLLVTLGSLAPTSAADSLQFQPYDAAGLPETISSPMGDVVIDLSEATVSADRTVAIRVAAGDVRVVCGDHINVVVEANVGAGRYSDPATSTDGPGSFRFEQRLDPTTPTLTLTVELGLGDLEVVTR